MIWREYHEATKHSVASLRRAPNVLDWANIPNPFRHYEGAPLLDLPADPPSPATPALDVLNGVAGSTTAHDGAAFLSQLLFYSASISASKLVPSTGYRYALRVNPSSGNLHPTEFHFATRGLRAWPDGLYHYRPSSHMAERRAAGDFIRTLAAGSSAPLVFLLTSIAWREAWKYRDRAYRYCLHDIGHAWQALALAARALGCEASARGGFVDDEVGQLCRLHEDEWPMLIIELGGASIPVREQGAGVDDEGIVWENGGGRANRLSIEVKTYAWIERIHNATKLSAAAVGSLSDPAGTGPAATVCSSRPFGAVARGRRSALDFVGGTKSISTLQLSTILGAAAGTPRFVELYLYIHRVVGLKPGVYRHRPDTGQLEPVKPGDQRVAAAGLSLGQDLAGNACVAFSMIGDLAGAVQVHGERGYRYVFFEAGAIGQRLYLAAEALGLGATGIGAFYDDQVHNYLNLAAPQAGQVVYNFAIGYPVSDPRLNA